MKLRSITLLALLCALSNCVSANIGLPTLEELLNAFIATYAKESRYLKKSVTSITHIDELPPGAQLGYAGNNIGYYYFFPKTWRDLSEPEKEMVYKDPRLKAFIISSRNATRYPADNAEPNPHQKTPSFPVNGFLPSTENTSQVRTAGRTNPTSAVPPKKSPPIVIEIPADELIKDVRYDVFIERIK